MAKLSKFKIFLTSLFGFFMVNQPCYAQDNDDDENSEEKDSSLDTKTLLQLRL